MREYRSMGGSAAGIAGSLLSAITSVCCTIPALSSAMVGILGVAGSVTLESLAPYRPWLLLGSALILAFALYVAFAPNRLMGVCPSRPGRLLNVSRFVTVASALLWFAGLGFWLAFP